MHAEFVVVASLLWLAWRRACASVKLVNSAAAAAANVKLVASGGHNGDVYGVQNYLSCCCSQASYTEPSI